MKELYGTNNSFLLVVQLLDYILYSQWISSKSVSNEGDAQRTIIIHVLVVKEFELKYSLLEANMQVKTFSHILKLIYIPSFSTNTMSIAEFLKFSKELLTVLTFPSHLSFSIPYCISKEN